MFYLGYDGISWLLASTL